jgi:hypothetical protein
MQRWYPILARGQEPHRLGSAPSKARAWAVNSCVVLWAACSALMRASCRTSMARLPSTSTVIRPGAKTWLVPAMRKTQDGRGQVLGQIERALLEGCQLAVAAARALGEDEQIAALAQVMRHAVDPGLAFAEKLGSEKSRPAQQPAEDGHAKEVGPYDGDESGNQRDHEQRIEKGQVVANHHGALGEAQLAAFGNDPAQARNGKAKLRR